MTHSLLHVGIGNVGREVVRQIRSVPHDLVYCGLFDREGGTFNAGGLSAKEIKNYLTGKDSLAEAIEQVKLPFTLIDTTASDSMTPVMLRAIARGGSVAMSNKKPVSGPQSSFDNLRQAGRAYIETTVGAGLPVIATLQDLLATGDAVEQIQGCFSGTLGYLFSEIEAGREFSDAVIQAKAQGFTEPDPRDDLSGTDVARKVLILARLAGQKLELADVHLKGLFPPAMAKLSPDEFMEALPELDADYAQRATTARGAGKVLRYIATYKEGTCRVGLEEVPATSDIGNLKGPDNIVVIQTERYHDNPLVIKGPGAGLAVTAAGVFADVLKAAGAAA